MFKQLDFGWLSIVAGLAICAFAVLLPAQEGLEKAQRQLVILEKQAAWLTSRLIAYDAFLQDLERSEPDFLQRLAASQLNLIPAGHTPILQDVSAGQASIEAWIESTVEEPVLPGHVQAESVLGSLSRGAFRTVFVAAGILCVFFGLLTSMPNRARGLGVVRMGTEAKYRPQ